MHQIGFFEFETWAFELAEARRRGLGSDRWVDRAQRKARETLEIYAPLANRLGVGQLKWELEDLAFRALHPTVAAELEGRLKGRHQERERYIEEVKGILSEQFVSAGFDVISNRDVGLGEPV